jgi:hypothetical protein
LEMPSFAEPAEVTCTTSPGDSGCAMTADVWATEREFSTGTGGDEELGAANRNTTNSTARSTKRNTMDMPSTATRRLVQALLYKLISNTTSSPSTAILNKVKDHWPLVRVENVHH